MRKGAKHTQRKKRNKIMQVRERERERETDRQTDRQTKTETETERDTEKQRQRQKHRETETDRERERQTDRQAGRQTDRQIKRTRVKVLSMPKQYVLMMQFLPKNRGTLCCCTFCHAGMSSRRHGL